MNGALRLSWRQQRTAILTVLGLCLLLGAATVAVHSTLRLDDPEWLARCLNGSLSCTENPGSFKLRYVLPLQGIGVLNVALPAVIGLFWGAPLLARDAEAGTDRLTLTQGVSRMRLFAARFGLAAFATVLVTGVTVLLFELLRTPTPGRRGESSAGTNWYDYYVLDGSGPRVVAAALCALALGTAAGALLRRVLPAMAVTLGTFGVLGTALHFLRRTFVPPEEVRFIANWSRSPEDAMWPVSAGYVTESGERASFAKCPAFDGKWLTSCMEKHGFKEMYAIGNPRSDQLVFQLLDCGVLLAVGAAAVLLTLRLLRRRRI